MSNIIQYFIHAEIQAVDLSISKSFNNQIVVFSNKTSVQTLLYELPKNKANSPISMTNCMSLDMFYTVLVVLKLLL